MLVEEPGAHARRTATPASTTSRCSLPERADLARWLAHAGRDRVPLVGLSDHFVSEAIYLSDPDGHGIEIYWDRPREVWEGQVGERMTTLPLDVESLLGELDDPAAEPFDGLPAGTVMGHVHLKVAAIPETVAFYRDVLGFDLMAQLGDAGRVPRRRRLPPPRRRQHVGERRRAAAAAGHGGAAPRDDRAPGRRRARAGCWARLEQAGHVRRAERTTGRASATRRGMPSCLLWSSRRLRRPRSRRRSCAWRRTIGPFMLSGFIIRPVWIVHHLLVHAVPVERET